MIPWLLAMALALATAGAIALVVSLRWRLGVTPMYVLAATLVVLTWTVWIDWSQAQATVPPWLLIPQTWGVLAMGLVALPLVAYAVIGTLEMRRLSVYITGMNFLYLLLQLMVSLSMARGDTGGEDILIRFISPLELPVPMIVVFISMPASAILYQFFTNTFKTLHLGARLFGALAGAGLVNLGLYYGLNLADQQQSSVLILGPVLPMLGTAATMSLVLWPYCRVSLDRYDPTPLGRPVLDVFRYESKLRRTVQELKTTRSRYARLFQNVREFVFFADSEGLLTECNEMASALLQRDPKQLEGENVFQLLFRDSREFDAVREALEVDRAVYDVQLTVQRPGGSRRSVLFSCQRLSSADDPPGGYQGLVRDITDLVEARRELEATNTQLRSARKEIEDIIRITNHDLQGPIMSIEGYLHLMKKRAAEVDTDLGHYLDRIGFNTARMKDLIQSLVMAARVGRTGTAEPDVSLLTIVREIATDVLERFADLDPMVHLPETDVTVTCVPIEIHQLFSNLIINAMKYSRPGVPPTVTVDWTSIDGELHVTCADNGVGMAPRHIDRIFEATTRLQNKEGVEGSGMGLFITEKIVTRNGGRIWVESIPEVGSTFHFTLPMVEEQKTKELKD